jgi:hypothetical protein
MDPASLLSALVSGLTLLLAEVRRRGDPAEAKDVRAALLDLEIVLSNWQATARDTNSYAKDWADDLPASAGSAAEYVDTPSELQVIEFESAREMFRTPFSKWRSGDHGDMTLEDLLRVYAPQVLDLAPFLVDRKGQLRRGMSDELERRYRTGGSQGVREYLDELERSHEGLEAFRRELADFIEAEFPLSR